MRACKKNKQWLAYSKLVGTSSTNETDSESNTIYDTIDGQLIARPQYDTIPEYTKPVEFYGNVHSSGGQAQDEYYGISTADYDAVLYMPKGSIDLDETCILWYDHEIKYKDEEQTQVDPTSADFRIKRVPPCLNERVYLLERIDK